MTSKSLALESAKKSGAVRSGPARLLTIHTRISGARDRSGLLHGFLAILGFALLASACHKNPARPVMTGPPAPKPAPNSPPPVPVPAEWPELPLPPSLLPAPPEPPLPKNFRDGEASFQSGKYAEAIYYYDKYIREDPITQYRDVAMFRQGIAYTLACTKPDCRVKSLERSREQLQRLVSLYPQSPYSAEARFILSLAADIEKMKTDAKATDEKIKRLSDELDRLKKIDLERQTAPVKKK